MGTHKELAEVSGAKIKVIGVGGGGGNAVNTMIRAGLEGVEFYTANTDVQALKFSLAPNKIQIGKELTKGLGAGADPDVGRDAALENRQEIQDSIGDADMVFITAGMGGGTGTGAAAITAQIARECGALTVAVVTKPFNFEGKRRRKHAEMGIARLRECVDTLITIPNQRLLQIATPDLSMVDAFKMADNVLVNAVKGISDIINIPGTVNVDFADVKTVMSSMGHALMGIGFAAGEGRAAAAARQAIRSPLLEDVDIEGATGILINITAGSTVSLLEINEACSIIQEAAHEDANIIFGAVIDESMGDGIRVTVIATGFPMQESDDSEIIIKPASAFPLVSPKPNQNLNVKPQPPLTPPIASRAESPSFEARAPQHFETIIKKDHETQNLPPVFTQQQPAESGFVAVQQVMMPPPVQPLVMPPTASGVFSSEVLTAVESYVQTARTSEIVSQRQEEWSVEKAFGDIVPEDFEIKAEPAAGKRVFQDSHAFQDSPSRLEGARLAGTSASFEDEVSSLNVLGDSIEQKIDEALDLADSFASSFNLGSDSDQDELEVPAFLRMGSAKISDP